MPNSTDQPLFTCENLKISSVSSNCGRLTTSFPSGFTTKLAPSKTKSSWAPTIFKYTIGIRFFSARLATKLFRTLSFSLAYGEPFGVINKSAPALTIVSATSSNQISSQIGQPILIPEISKGSDTGPEEKVRCSSKTFVFGK